MAERGHIYCLYTAHLTSYLEELNSRILAEYKIRSVASGSRASFLCYYKMDDFWPHVIRFLRMKPIVCLQVMLQEGAIWEYVAYEGDKQIDKFSVCSSYWGDDEGSGGWEGNPSLISRLFNVDLNSIEKYYTVWPQSDTGFSISGKAYDTDSSEYGMVHQALDFIKALGFQNPI